LPAERPALFEITRVRHPTSVRKREEFWWETELLEKATPHCSSVITVALDLDTHIHTGPERQSEDGGIITH